MWWEASPTLFFKKLKSSIYLDQQSKILYTSFLLYVQNIFKLRCHLLSLYVKFFFKTKRSGMIFEEKNFSRFILLNLVYPCLIAITAWYIGQYVYCNYLFSNLWRHKFEINFSFLIKPFSYMFKKPGQNLNILRTKRAFSIKWKNIFHHF